MEVQTWPIDRIVVKDRARTDTGDLDGLKESLTAVGQLQPIAAEPDGTLLFGERRLLAARDLGWTEIAVSVIANLTDLQRLLVERDENTCRKEMSPAERTLLFDRIEAIQQRLTRPGPNSENFSPSPSGSESRKSRDKSAKAAGISHASAKKVREVREAAADPDETPEVREEAQRQYEALQEPDARVDRAHKAVRQARAKAERKSTLSSEPLPGQWTEPPPTKTEPTLTRRLTDGINKGQNLKDLAVEINDQELDLDISTLYVLRNRMQDEISIRQTMKDALNQQIEQRGYSTRKASAR